MALAQDCSDQRMHEFHNRHYQLYAPSSFSLNRKEYLNQSRELSQQLWAYIAEIKNTSQLSQCRHDALMTVGYINQYLLDNYDSAKRAYTQAGWGTTNLDNWEESSTALKQRVDNSTTPVLRAQSLYNWSSFLGMNQQTRWWQREYLKEALALKVDFPEEKAALGLLIALNDPVEWKTWAIRLLLKFPGTLEWGKAAVLLAIRATDLTEHDIQEIAAKSETNDSTAYAKLLAALRQQKVSQSSKSDYNWELSVIVPPESLPLLEKNYETYPDTYGGRLSGYFAGMAAVNTNQLKKAEKIAFSLQPIEMSSGSGALLPRLLISLGDKYLIAGDTIAAINAYQKAYDSSANQSYIDPDKGHWGRVGADVLMRLAQIELYTGNTAEGLKYYELVLSTFGDYNRCQPGTDACSSYSESVILNIEKELDKNQAEAWILKQSNSLTLPAGAQNSLSIWLSKYSKSDNRVHYLYTAAKAYNIDAIEELGSIAISSGNAALEAQDNLKNLALLEGEERQYIKQFASFVIARTYHQINQFSKAINFYIDFIKTSEHGAGNEMDGPYHTTGEAVTFLEQCYRDSKLPSDIISKRLSETAETIPKHWGSKIQLYNSAAFVAEQAGLISDAQNYLQHSISLCGDIDYLQECRDARSGIARLSTSKE